jgi:hypothetical protein
MPGRNQTCYFPVCARIQFYLKVRFQKNYIFEYGDFTIGYLIGFDLARLWVGILSIIAHHSTQNIRATSLPTNTIAKPDNFLISL